jgi:large subunit ribosomal protein L4e
MSGELAAARPVISVFDLRGRSSTESVDVPAVLLAPIRSDLVNFVHTNMSKNNRQPYAVRCNFGPKGIVAGHDLSARSWGTGRAVSRIPRVRGGGTHRAGQGAFANICRGGRMFAPTKTWRRWHRKINKNQKRYAVASAIAASAVPSLVMARGHRIQKLDEVPLVVSGDFESLKKTKAAVAALRALKLGSELKRCKRRYKRAGRGKQRNRRWRHRLGPLIVYKDDKGITRAARNIRGVDFCRVDQLNLLKLAPGGHIGRMIVWTAPAFRELNTIFGSATETSEQKKGYRLPRPMITNSDVSKVINSLSIQSSLRAKRRSVYVPKKRNPLKRPELYAKLNPAFAEEIKGLMEKYPGAKPRTTILLKPSMKKLKVRAKPTLEQRKELKKYFDMVIGEKPTKSRQLLKLERIAVRQAVAAAEAEKKGADLVEQLRIAAEAAAAEAE